jgi:glutamate-ammonia-ligase adenylyltransferase
MRLRPSGRQGPLATSLRAFRSYQAGEAWTWEHLALTRARVLAGPADLKEEVAAAIAEALAGPKDEGKVLADARDMRRRLADANTRSAANPWSTKHGPGRMLDIELLAQTGALRHELTSLRRPRRMLDKLAKLGWIAGEDAEALAGSHARLAALQQVARLASDHTIDPAEGGDGLVQLVLTVTGAGDLDALKAELAAEAARCDGLIAARLEAP